VASKTFSGKGQVGNLSDPNNWVGGVAPGITDLVTINTSVGGPIGGTFEVANLMLLGPEQITFTGTLDTYGNPVLCQGLMVCVGAGATFAPGATLNDTGVLIVGNGKAGTLIAEGSGATHSVLNTITSKLGSLAGGIGTVTIDDAIWKNNGPIVIGNLGEGTVNVQDSGSVVATGDVDMAIYTGSRGQMTVASGGTVTVDGILWDGVSGVSSITVSTGGTLTADKAIVVGTGSTLILAGGAVDIGASGQLKTMAGGTISGFGTLASPGGLATFDIGTIDASGGTLAVSGNIIGTGSLQIASNSTAMLTGSSLSLASIAFIGPAATLSLAHGASVSSAITGFALGDMITMAGVSAVSFNAATDMLKLTETSGMTNLHVVGNFTGYTFDVHQSGGLGVISLQHI
jgi:T5SS/PEP-CTERM-associated repeat protein